MSPETLRVAKSENPLAVEAIAQVRRWVELAAREKSDGSGRRLAGLLGDPNGLAFAVGFIDGVIRPEDIRVAARNLSGLAPTVPRFLPWLLRFAPKAGVASRTLAALANHSHCQAGAEAVRLPPRGRCIKLETWPPTQATQKRQCKVEHQPLGRSGARRG